ncbi:MAG: hypothetical protein WCP29_11535 [Acidobacteriota bacterium]
MIPVCLTVVLLFAGTARGAGTDPCLPRSSPAASPSQQRHAWRSTANLVDENTGAAMRLTRLPSGAVQVIIEGAGLEVNKTVYPSGDFALVVKADDDRVVVVRHGDRLRVSRRNRTLEFGGQKAGEADFDQLQQSLAASAAVGRFRAMRSMLTSATRCTGLGAAVDTIDLLFGTLKGEPPRQDLVSAAPMAAAVDGVDSEAEIDDSSCYMSWVGEVVLAWNDYEGCIYTFAWYNPLREVCAFAWVIRVESAWFRLIGCSSFPIKGGACDADSQGVGN